MSRKEFSKEFKESVVLKETDVLLEAIGPSLQTYSNTDESWSERNGGS